VVGPVRPSAAELVQTPGALLTSSHLAELGLSRRAVGQKMLSVTADTYTHVLSDGREADYEELLAA
jgi:hypothetical protein